MNKGQSLFEVVVALAISALIIVAVVSLVTNSIRNSTFSKNQSLAATYAQQTTEWLRGQRDSDIAAFIAKSGSSTDPAFWCMSDLGFTNKRRCQEDNPDDAIPNTPFYRDVKLINTTSPTGKTLIETDITITWSDSQTLHTITSATTFTDWRQR